MTTESDMRKILAKRGAYDGWTILNGDNCIKVKHDASKRVFTLESAEEGYWEIYASSPKIDGPYKSGPMIAKIHGLRNALLAIGFIKQR